MKARHDALLPADICIDPVAGLFALIAGCFVLMISPNDFPRIIFRR
jgi:hypothetical protein